MIPKNIVILEASDCCEFHNQESHGDAIQYFLKQKQRFNVFQFNNAERDDENNLANFDYRTGKWLAGRFVGESNFEFKGINYKIVINPRFGNNQLFRMLEEIFNIRLTESKSVVEKKNDIQILIKKLIALLWVSILAKANKHGIPREYVSHNYKGTAIRGKLNVRKSIVPLHSESKIVSEYREKIASDVIVRILFKAYRILRSDFGLGDIKISAAAKNALEQIATAKVSEKHVTESEYLSINYKSIYLSFKPIVDLSWDIIKKRNFGNQESDQSDSLSFFIDMAEIWELYLTALLKKEFTSAGWKIHSPKIPIYSDKDFKRNIIPDIVMEKGKNAIVWDAKYKRMKFDYFDFDRADFFQIHTYVHYYMQNQNVIAGGLLYPISSKFDELRRDKNYSSSLFSSNSSKVKFVIDGIELTDLTNDNINREETNFLNRISSIINAETNESYR